MDLARPLPSLVALTLLVAAPLAGQAPEPAPPPEPADLSEALAPFVHPLKVTEGRLEGPGAAVLLQEAEKAHFFLLGEQHATVEIAELATALFRALAPLGYQHAAVEVGPAGARGLESLLQDEDAGALATALPADRTVLVDLQALRSEPGLLERLDETSRKLVWAYDGYVAVPDAHAATFFPGERPDFGQ